MAGLIALHEYFLAENMFKSVDEVEEAFGGADVVLDSVVNFVEELAQFLGGFRVAGLDDVLELVLEDLQFTLVVELAEPDDAALGEQSGVGRAVLGEVALVVVEGDDDAQVLLEPLTEGLENVHLIVLLFQVLLVGEHLLDFFVRVEPADLSRTYE